MPHSADPRPPIADTTRFQNATWITERVFWLVLVLLIALALAGLFSKGPLSQRTINGEGVSVSYERFQRNTAQTRFTFRLPTTGADQVRLGFGTSFVENYEIEDVEPRPKDSTGDARTLDLFFSKGQAAEVVVSLLARPKGFGAFAFTVTANGGAPVTLPVFVYP